MVNAKKVFFIGCGVLGPDTDHIAKKLNLNLEKTFLPGGLHNQPAALRQKLQDTINDVGQDPLCRRIIIGYGLCGRGTVGIKAPGAPLIFPKVHDCIALFMGGNHAYREEFTKIPGTFYISAGWYKAHEQCKRLKTDMLWTGSRSMGYQEIKNKYGEKRSRDIIQFLTTWKKNYKRAAFIDTGIGKTSQYEKYAQEMANKNNWTYQRIQGDSSLMIKLLTATDSDDQILVVPPHHITVYSATDNMLAATSENRKKTSKKDGYGAILPDEEINSDIQVRYGLGIDAGGTYTDAVIYDFKKKRLLCKNKALTTKWDFSIGIKQALSRLDTDLLSAVQLISVSTTLATNAIVEGEVQKAGLILMPGRANIPEELHRYAPLVQVKGQLNINGEEIEPIHPNEIREKAGRMIEKYGITAFTVSGFAAAVNPAHELEVKKVLQRETGFVVTCGHELSDLLNFLVRARTALLNAGIIPRMVKFFKEAHPTF